MHLLMRPHDAQGESLYRVCAKHLCGDSFDRGHVKGFHCLSLPPKAVRYADCSVSFSVLVGLLQQDKDNTTEFETVVSSESSSHLTLMLPMELLRVFHTHTSTGMIRRIQTEAMPTPITVWIAVN